MTIWTTAADAERERVDLYSQFPPALVSRGRLQRGRRHGTRGIERPRLAVFGPATGADLPRSLSNLAHRRWDTSLSAPQADGSRIRLRIAETCAQPKARRSVDLFGVVQAGDPS